MSHDLSSSCNPLILYATETGTAQDVANRVARHCRRMQAKSRVVNMEDYPPEELIAENLVIFLVSTSGTGAEPRSMTPLWTMLLRSDLPKDLFEDMEFAVFGLGDTAYEKFCWPAKKLCRRLESLGARKICARGEGDEQHQLGIDGALDPWMDNLLDALVQLHPIPKGSQMMAGDNLPPARVSMTRASSDSLSTSIDPRCTSKIYHAATVSCNKRITAEGWYQDVRHFEFDFEDDIQYLPGDVAVIHPEASEVEVEAFLNSMGYANVADEPFTIEHTVTDQSVPDHLPKTSTLRILFTRYVDFNAVPRRSFFQILRHFTTDDLEREKLEDFTTAEGADELYEYCFRVRRTIREIFAEFRSARIPREYILDVFPPLRPRQFSIASSVKRHPRQMQLCVAIVRYKTKLKVPRKGVCTSFLAALRPGDSLLVGIQKGVIVLPKNICEPVICIGPGTGIAPMRCLIEERIHDGSKHNTLYFGCRSASKDHHYSTDWLSYAHSENITYRVAYSRDGPEGVKRTYVQDLIREDAKRIWELIGETGAWVYISGSSNKMPAGVREALMFAMTECGKKSEEQARDFLKAMESDGRLIEECWS